MPPYTGLGWWKPWKTNWVRTPNMCPAPRMAQNRSGSSVFEHCTIRPSAKTISADSRLSMARPFVPDRKPNPPPVVYPATPVCCTVPPTLEILWGADALSISSQRQPPPQVRVNFSVSTLTEFIRLMLMSMPSAIEESPAVPWPPKSDQKSPIRLLKWRTTNCSERNGVLPRKPDSSRYILTTFRINNDSLHIFSIYRKIELRELTAGFSMEAAHLFKAALYSSDPGNTT